MSIMASAVSSKRSMKQSSVRPAAQPICMGPPDIGLDQSHLLDPDYRIISLKNRLPNRLKRLATTQILGDSGPARALSQPKVRKLFCYKICTHRNSIVIADDMVWAFWHRWCTRNSLAGALQSVPAHRAAK
jgi:hypothetical protein